MDRQKLLDDFISATAGKGQCTVDGGTQCLYIKEGHPGCAIGCQPGFREKFGKEEWIRKNPNIDSLLTGNEGQETQLAVEEFFGVVHRPEDADYSGDGGDVHFLSKLQELHDGSAWEENGELCKEYLDDFCELWKLKIPQKSS